MSQDNTVKLVQTVNKVSLFSGPIVGSSGGGGGSVSNGRTTNLEKAVNSGYVITAGYAPYRLAGAATVSHAATIWTQVSGGSQITDLKNWDGTTASSLATDADGGLFFQAPVANTILYVDLGSTRIKVDRVFTITHTHVIADVANLQTTIDGKSDTSHNHNATYQALSGKNAANGYAGLDGSTKITIGQIPSLSGTYVAVSTANAANGYLQLDSTGVAGAAQSLVSSVNSAIGDVVLAAADVGAYTTSQVDALITSTTTLKVIVEAGGVYALRNTVSTSSTIPIIWVGTDAPTIGSGYAINNVDIWFVKS